MSNNSKPRPENADRPSRDSLAELQARQAALIRQGQDVMRELDAVTAQIAQRQSNRDDAKVRWNHGEPAV